MEIIPKLLFQLEGSFAILINDCETELKRQIHGSISLGMFYYMRHIICPIKKIARF